ncbi:MAG: hypothetical protein WDW36_007680 [Sanguina aurantia]
MHACIRAVIVEASSSREAPPTARIQVAVPSAALGGVERRPSAALSRSPSRFQIRSGSDQSPPATSGADPPLLVIVIVSSRGSTHGADQRQQRAHRRQQAPPPLPAALPPCDRAATSSQPRWPRDATPPAPGQQRVGSARASETETGSRTAARPSRRTSLLQATCDARGAAAGIGCPGQVPSPPPPPLLTAAQDGRHGRGRVLRADVRQRLRCGGGA